MTSLPARSRGSIALLEENCTVCMLCVQECPVWCIEIDAHAEPLPAVQGAPGGRGRRERSRNVLDRFDVDYGLCMYCGICIEVCPFDALFWAPTPTPPATATSGMVHDRARLREVLPDVPAPPPLSASAEGADVTAAEAGRPA